MLIAAFLWFNVCNFNLSTVSCETHSSLFTKSKSFPIGKSRETKRSFVNTYTSLSDQRYAYKMYYQVESKFTVLWKREGQLGCFRYFYRICGRKDSYRSVRCLARLFSDCYSSDLTSWIWPRPWIWSFLRDWSCLIFKVLVTLAKFLELFCYCTEINYAFFFRTKMVLIASAALWLSLTS